MQFHDLLQFLATNQEVVEELRVAVHHDGTNFNESSSNQAID